jgi:hypothetical protein
MTLEEALRLVNRNMIAFDLMLGTAAIAAPAATLKVLGHDEPSPDAKHLFRRCGPIWLTFAAAHLVADALWSASPAVSRPGAKRGLQLAGAANVAMAAGFAWMSRRG